MSLRSAWNWIKDIPTNTNINMFPIWFNKCMEGNQFQNCSIWHPRAVIPASHPLFPPFPLPASCPRWWSASSYPNRSSTSKPSRDTPSWSLQGSRWSVRPYGRCRTKNFGKNGTTMYHTLFYRLFYKDPKKHESQSLMAKWSPSIDGDPTIDCIHASLSQDLKSPWRKSYMDERWPERTDMSLNFQLFVSVFL